MTDFILKARANRILALTELNAGEVMFFPERYARSTVRPTRAEAADAVAHIKPMFVRSGSLSMERHAPDAAHLAATVVPEPLRLRAA